MQTITNELTVFKINDITSKEMRKITTKLNNFGKQYFEYKL